MTRLERESCIDCISRQAVLECLDWYDHDRCEIDIYIRDIVEDIKKLPSVQPEQKVGHWIRRVVDSGYNANWKCSECGYKEMTDFPTKYCPFCGLKMEVKE